MAGSFARWFGTASRGTDHQTPEAQRAVDSAGTGSTGHVLELREVERIRPFETAFGEHLNAHLIRSPTTRLRQDAQWGISSNCGISSGVTHFRRGFTKISSFGSISSGRSRLPNWAKTRPGKLSRLLV